MTSVWAHPRWGPVSALCVGGLFGYAFCNPDETNVYDIFPVLKTKLAFISFFKVEPENMADFESKWKDMGRSRQSSEGYLFTQLYRPRGVKKAAQNDYQFIEVSQWTQPDCFQRVFNSLSYRKLSSLLPIEDYKPKLYKMVVNDGDFASEELK